VQLIAEVRAQGADLGIAFDGDADRIGAVDNEGNILAGDQLLVILARDVLKSHPGGTIIADVKASQVLFDEVARAGGKPLMWRTGHSLIKAKMAETGAPLAGEMSGHVFFADKWYGFDDALYAAVRLLGITARLDTKLSDVRAGLGKVVNTPELRFDCDDTRKFGVIEEVAGRLKAEGADVSSIDGVRVNTADGWWLLRASNTQAVLVARAEAHDEAGLDRLKAALVKQLTASGLAEPDFNGDQAGH
jgi:phosphomannomutase